jgi:hypothetical protein
VARAEKGEVRVACAGLCDALGGLAKRAECCAWESQPVRFGPVVLGCVLVLAGRLGAGFGSKSRLG